MMENNEELTMEMSSAEPEELSDDENTAEDTADSDMETESEALTKNIETLSQQVQMMKSQLDEMAYQFEQKIKTDEYKNSLFDNMHKELTAFRNGVVEKNVELMAKDIIPLLDSYSGQLKSFPQRENDEGYQNIFNALQYLLDDLTDVLYRQDFESYTVIDDTRTVDTRRQKIVKTVATNDPSLENKICEQIAPGYCRGEKIIRPEKISIYKYSAETHPSE